MKPFIIVNPHYYYTTNTTTNAKEIKALTRVESEIVNPRIVLSYVVSHRIHILRIFLPFYVRIRAVPDNAEIKTFSFPDYAPLSHLDTAEKTSIFFYTPSHVNSNYIIKYIQFNGQMLNICENLIPRAVHDNSNCDYLLQFKLFAQILLPHNLSNRGGLSGQKTPRDRYAFDNAPAQLRTAKWKLCLGEGVHFS